MRDISIGLLMLNICGCIGFISFWPGVEYMCREKSLQFPSDAHMRHKSLYLHYYPRGRPSNCAGPRRFTELVLSVVKRALIINVTAILGH